MTPMPMKSQRLSGALVGCFTAKALRTAERSAASWRSVSVASEVGDDGCLAGASVDTLARSASTAAKCIERSGRGELAEFSGSFAGSVIGVSVNSGGVEGFVPAVCSVA